MFSRFLRSCALVLAVGTSFIATLLLILPGTAEGQVKDAPAQPPPAQAGVMKGMGKAGPKGKANPDDPNVIGEFGSVTLVTDKRPKQKLDAARDFMKEKDWPNVVKILQGLLDLEKEDVMVPVPRKGADGTETISWVSVHREANRMIGELPKEGMEFYKLQNNQKSAELLKQAKETSDVRLLAKVATAYLHTDAGAEATELLATRMMDRGEFEGAALCFERLMQREGVEKLAPLTLFKAKLAFSRCRDENAKANAEVVTRQLEARAPDGLRLGESNFSLTQLNDIVTRYADPLQARATIFDWLMGLGGTPNRNGQGVGGSPFLEKVWEQSLFYPEEGKNQAQGWVDSAEKNLVETRHAAVLPASHPVAATAEVPKEGLRQLIVYRSHWGIHAVDIKTGKLKWDAGCTWNLEDMYRDRVRGNMGSVTGTSQALHNWENQYKQVGRPNIVFENSIIGALSTDGQRVYCVDDLPVPPFVAQFFNGWGQPQFPWSQAVNEAMHYNVLQAFDLGNGKAAWELGGRGDKRNPWDPKGELNDCYFLGAPLAIGGKLYVLTDKNQELRLVCLDAAKGTIIWIQTLATTKEKMLMDIGRRSQAAPLAYGEGILVCPTNSGAIIGVDFLTHSLLWAYAYREHGATKDHAEEQMQGMGMGGRRVWVNGMQPGVPQHNPNDWKVSAPVIVDGKVVFTAPDGSTIDCLNVRDGSRVWRTNKLDGDLYLAGVYAGRALIVGKDRCRAINISDGTPAWAVDTGMPSGRGVASDNVYYLPLRSGVTHPHEPEVCAIDVAKGSVLAHTKSRKDRDGKQEVPGNLLFYEGCMLSQTATRVAAYPQLKIKLQEIDERIARDPRDPAGLTERGALRLDKGKDELRGAVEDLRTALANNPPPDVLPRTKSKLYEAMTDLFREQFNDAEKFLPEYEAMCKASDLSDEERQRRQSTLLYLVAKGREGQGRLLDAFDYYQKFGEQAGNKELVSVPDDGTLKVPPDVWAQGRIAAMVAKAPAEARLPLERQIANVWENVQKSGDTERLRQFVTMFGSLFRAGKEARLQLAERLVDESSKSSMLEAERHLLLLRGQKEDSQLAARAVEALARLWTRNGLLEDAAFCYALLAREFPKVTVRDGKTGAELYAELATDKRFLPYIDTPAGGIVHGEIRSEIQRNTGTGAQQMIFGFEPRGEQLPFFQRNRVAMSMNQFKVIDRKTNEDVWTEHLPNTNFQNYIQVYVNGPQPLTPRYAYHSVGHIIVLPVVNMVFGLDPIGKKVLWKEDLLGKSKNPPQQQTFSVDPNDGQLTILYLEGYALKVGQIGPVGASYVCLQTKDGLLAVDPVSGRPLWTRSDVSTRSHLFGDDEYVYAVEIGPEGTASGSRAFRAADGATVKVPEFAALYQKRVRTIGRNILLSDGGDKSLSLRLYDVHEGKDVWKRDFKPRSLVLKSEEPNLAGVIEPDGKTTIIDLTTQKELWRGEIRPEHIAKAEEVYLLEDAQHFYLAINGPKDANNNPGMPGGGVAQSGLAPGSGMRSIPVNGYFYALYRQNGGVNWYNPIQHQQVVLEHFKEMPILMFTARPFDTGPKRFNNPGMQMQMTSFCSVNKRTGKRLLDETDISQNVMFHALNMDLRAGKIELLGHQVRIMHYLPNYDAAAAKNAKPATPPPGGRSTGAAPGRRLGGVKVAPAAPVQVIEKK